MASGGPNDPFRTETAVVYALYGKRLAEARLRMTGSVAVRGQVSVCVPVTLAGSVVRSVPPASGISVTPKPRPADISREAPFLRAHKSLTNGYPPCTSAQISRSNNLIPKGAHITSVFSTLILVVVVITVNARFVP